MAFWGSKALLSAVELGLASLLARGPRTGHEIETALGLAPHGASDFLDTLVALGMLARGSVGASARYRNPAVAVAFLDREGPRHVGGILEIANARLYRFWGGLTEAPKTGRPQNKIKRSGRLMSLSMLIEIADAFDCTGAAYADWCREAGFRRIEVIPLGGPGSARAVSLRCARCRTSSAVTVPVPNRTSGPMPNITAKMPARSQPDASVMSQYATRPSTSATQPATTPGANIRTSTQRPA